MTAKVPRVVQPGEDEPAEYGGDFYPDRAVVADGPAAVEPMGAHTLTNHGGSVIGGVDLVLIVPDGWYGGGDQLFAAAQDIVLGGYLDGLKPYGSGRGKSVTRTGFPASASWQPGMAVLDSGVQALVEGVIANGHAPSATTLYMVMCPQGVTIQFDSDPTHGASCTAFCGYHSAFIWQGREIYYGIICDTTPGCCNGGHTAFEGATMVLAHEIAEACTDAWPGRGWYEDSSGSENADLCAWQNTSYGAWTVQPFWTNESGGYVGLYEDHHTVTQPQGGGGGQPNPHAALWAWIGQLTANAAYQTDAELAVVAQTLRHWGF